MITELLNIHPVTPIPCILQVDSIQYDTTIKRFTIWDTKDPIGYTKRQGKIVVGLSHPEYISLINQTSGTYNLKFNYHNYNYTINFKIVGISSLFGGPLSITLPTGYNENPIITPIEE